MSNETMLGPHPRMGTSIIEFLVSLPVRNAVQRACDLAFWILAVVFAAYVVAVVGYSVMYGVAPSPAKRRKTNEATAEAPHHIHTSPAQPPALRPPSAEFLRRKREMQALSTGSSSPQHPPEESPSSP